MRILMILALAGLLGACSNTVASLTYTPTHAVAIEAAPVIGSVTSHDQRQEAPARLATIMGGFGNPLKTLDTATPVKDEVAHVFAEGLERRGLLASGDLAPYRLVLLITKFDADMIIGRTARIDIVMSVENTAGQTIYRQQVIDSLSDLKFFQTGVFAKIEDLQLMSEQLLSRTVDRLLDNPAFRAALAGGVPAV